MTFRPFFFRLRMVWLPRGYSDMANKPDVRLQQVWCHAVHICLVLLLLLPQPASVVRLVLGADPRQEITQTRADEEERSSHHASAETPPGERSAPRVRHAGRVGHFSAGGSHVSCYSRWILSPQRADRQGAGVRARC